MQSVGGANDVPLALKDNLPLVTGNLATAFDTTFFALALSIPLMLMLTWAEKASNSHFAEYGLRKLQTQPVGAASSRDRTPVADCRPTDRGYKPLPRLCG